MHRSVRALLLGAVACAAGFLVVLIAAYATSGGAWLDRSALEGFGQLQGPLTQDLTRFAVRFGDPAEVALIGLALAAVAAARGRPRIAIAIIALVAATSVSSQLLKALLAHSRGGPDIFVAAKALPSGHATAAMALALAAVLAAPRRARPAAALIGAAFALAVGFSVVSLGWHFPSDVLAGYLLATGWALVLAAGLRASERRWPARSGRGRAKAFTMLAERVSADGMAAGAMLVAFAAVAGFLVLLGTHPDQLADYGRDHTASVGVAAGLTAAALVLPAAMAAALRRA
jgi:membrane-associated phospholipid phosphatase